MSEKTKKILIGVAIVLALLIIGCSVLLIKNNNEPKTEEKADNKKDIEKNEEKKNDSKDNKAEDIEEINDGVLRVPNLRGLTVEEAVAKLNEKKITARYLIKRIDNDQKKDTIVKTEPEINTPVEGELEITFYLSKGIKNFTVENYVGKPISEVKVLLETAEIIVVIEEKEYKGNLDESQVVGQSIKAGTKIGPGDKIILYIPTSELTYPDFTNGNYTENEVRNFCNEYEIQLTVLYDEPDGTQIPGGKMPKEGTVFYMDKTTKDVVKKGDSLTISVARY